MRADKPGLTPFNPIEVTKATALALLCEDLGIDTADVVSVGDNHNDITMLEWAGPWTRPAAARSSTVSSKVRISTSWLSMVRSSAVIKSGQSRLTGCSSRKNTPGSGPRSRRT